MKNFTNKKGISYLLLDVPEDAREVFVSNSKYPHLYYYCNKYLDGESHILHGLPKGNYELIGLAKDVSEEVAADIVDYAYHPRSGYYDYNDKSNLFVYSPLPSLTSLVQSLGLTNPIILKIIK